MYRHRINYTRRNNGGNTGGGANTGANNPYAQWAQQIKYAEAALTLDAAQVDARWHQIQAQERNNQINDNLLDALGQQMVAGSTSGFAISGSAVLTMQADRARAAADKRFSSLQGKIAAHATLYNAQKQAQLLRYQGDAVRQLNAIPR